jgi:hypothetical protein
LEDSTTGQDLTKKYPAVANEERRLFSLKGNHEEIVDSLDVYMLSLMH